MKIEKLVLKNFRSAKDTVLEFTSQLNLFVGVNGSGKSTVLDALSICLSWLLKRIERDSGRGTYIADSSLTLGEDDGLLYLFVTQNKSPYKWLISKTAKRKSSRIESQFTGVTELAESIRESYEKNMSWPVIAYYPVNRVVNDVRPNIPDRDSIYNLDVYENALGGKTNYQSFFKWFRVQDDILNEKSTSRKKWMQQNRNFIKRNVQNIFNLLKGTVSDHGNDPDIKNYRYVFERFEKDMIIYEEPRFLFRELSHIIAEASMFSRVHSKYEIVLHDLEYMFHKMSVFSSEFRDDLINEGIIFDKIIIRFIDNLNRIYNKENKDKKMIVFFWETFSFALLLSFWWLSDSGKRKLKHEFNILRKSLVRNELNTSHAVSMALIKRLRQIISREIFQKRNVYRNEGKELHVVAGAIEQFVPEYKNLRVQRVPRPRMLIDKNRVTFDLEQLSDGEKNLIALVGDIARRLSIANPKMNNPLKGEGIILIDEIDLHLHPSWQRLAIPKILKIFPNCQFFITTHSPQVLSHVKPNNIFLLENKNNELSHSKARESYGINSDRILEDLLRVDARPTKEKKQLHKIFQLIQNNELVKANNLIKKLYNLIGDDPELTKAKVLIKRKEVIGK